ncbi:hypothetical protein RFI_29161, partial [Reticulomyxa filosa]
MYPKKKIKYSHWTNQRDWSNLGILQMVEMGYSEDIGTNTEKFLFCFKKKKNVDVGYVVLRLRNYCISLLSETLNEMFVVIKNVLMIVYQHFALFEKSKTGNIMIIFLQRIRSFLFRKLLFHLNSFDR